MPEDNNEDDENISVDFSTKKNEESHKKTKEEDGNVQESDNSKKAETKTENQKDIAVAKEDENVEESDSSKKTETKKENQKDIAVAKVDEDEKADTKEDKKKAGDKEEEEDEDGEKEDDSGKQKKGTMNTANSVRLVKIERQCRIYSINCLILQQYSFRHTEINNNREIKIDVYSKPLTANGKLQIVF